MKADVLSALILCAFLFAGCGNKQASSNNSADSGAIKVGDTFTIRLEANHTTGYSWSLADNKSDIVEKVSDVYEPYETAGNVVGSGGTEIWTFKAVAKGQATLNFQYTRPWEKGIPPVKAETYTIIVK